MRTVRSEGIQWKTGRNVDMFFVSAVLYFFILNNWKGGAMSGVDGIKGKNRTARRNYLQKQTSAKEPAYNM